MLPHEMLTKRKERISLNYHTAVIVIQELLGHINIYLDRRVFSHLS